ncbi:hypothetical protein A9Q68_08605 [Streptococcus bovimastitidis]|uniref:HK97 gp10 family phage protein n=1 Tax=Streptococcus bovimastitidis TaxID=1856638 RepID=A0A1L8MKI8_9STRE|nr:hypothetical protein [Streptococcus bovimastitidis]OJF71249.1 hypothetical protein A9Q68_08605 [Streptococcus bovimastitidis]
MKIDVKGLPVLEARFRAMNEIQWEAVVNKNLTTIFNRAARRPGTPIGKQSKGHAAGELMRSRRMIELNSGIGVASGMFYYSKDYAPHVEYGHRIVRGGRQVGYVTGQRFLFNNVQKQRTTYRNDMLNELRKKR